MKILLMCANGLSTGILMNKMNDWGKKNGEELEVRAVPVDECAGIYQDYDCLLIGPQMAYKLKEVQKIASDRPVAIHSASGLCTGTRGQHYENGETAD